MKKLLLATATALAAFTATAPFSHALFDNTYNLRGWQEDFATMMNLENHPYDEVRGCVERFKPRMYENRHYITIGEANSDVRLFMPAANHFRETYIMPEFEACIAWALEQNGVTG